jgi:hypothetical protein
MTKPAFIGTAAFEDGSSFRLSAQDVEVIVRGLLSIEQERVQPTEWPRILELLAQFQEQLGIYYRRDKR